MTESLQTNNPLDTAEVLTMPSSEALTLFRQYAAAARTSRRKQDAAIRDVFHALSEGRGVINITNAIKQAGVYSKNGHPKLAVLRANEPEVFFRRFANGAGIFGCRAYLARGRNAEAQRQLRQYDLPEGTLTTWDNIPREERPHSYQPHDYYEMHRAPAPVIPPQHRPPDSLSKFLLMWHVEEWKRVAPVDPMLLLPMETVPGMAVVVAHWDLTPVERAVMGALLGN